MADQRPDANTVNAHDNVVYCSGEILEDLMEDLQGYNAELVGHERNGHARAHLGKSFGRPEGEIREDIDRVTAQIVACNRDNRNA